MLLNLYGLIPEELRIDLSKKFQFDIFSKAISVTASQRALGEILGVSPQNIK